MPMLVRSRKRMSESTSLDHIPGESSNGTLILTNPSESSSDDGVTGEADSAMLSPLVRLMEAIKWHNLGAGSSF